MNIRTACLAILRVCAPLAALFTGALVAAPAAAQEEVGELSSPAAPPMSMRLSYVSDAYFNQGVKNQRSSLHMVSHDLRAAFPLVQTDTELWSLSTRVKALDLDGNVRLPSQRLLDLRGDLLPGELWDVRVGLGYRRRADNDWVWGGNVSFGSASDRPFASGEEMLLDATGFVAIPGDPGHAWVFLLNYSNNREFLRHVPLPGVAYHYRPDENLRLMLGVPFSAISWEPLERLTIDASYGLLRNARAEVGYRILDQVKLYAGYTYSNQRFFRADRQDEDDRLFYYEQRVMGGVRWDINKALWLDFGAGYAFDRFFFEAEDFDERNDCRIDIDSGPLLRLQVGLRV